MIGSFRKHLPEMQQAIKVFTENKIEVVNPLSTEVLNDGADFVRLASDESDLSDAEVQANALVRILGSSAVYVVCPRGYVGKTSSYEWGWIEGRGAAAYFSDLPDMLFMRRYTKDRIVTPFQLSKLILNGETKPLEV